MQCGFRLSAALKLSNNGGVLSGTLIGQEMKMSNEARGPCDGAEAPDPPTTHSLKSAAFDGHTLTLVIDLYGNDANAQATMSGDKLILQGGENNGIVFTKIQ